MKRLAVLAGLLLCLSAAGCGSSGDPDLLEVAGKVTQGAEPLSHVLVSFVPDGDTKGNGGFGRTDAEGMYTIKTHDGKSGLPPGKYRVVLSRLLLPDGTPFTDTEVGPMDSPARETLAPQYSNLEQTILRADVRADGGPYDHPLPAAK